MKIISDYYIQQDQLIVDVDTLFSKEVVFACYLYYSDIIVERKHYQKSPKFHFQIDQTSDLEAFHYRVYVRNNKTQEVVSQNFRIYNIPHYHFKDASVASVIDGVFQRQYCYTDTEGSLAKQLLEGGKLILPPYNSVDVDLNQWSWQIDPFKSRSWQLRFFSFSFLPAAISYHKKTNNKKDIDAICSIVNAWLKNCSSNWINQTSSTQDMNWHDHAVSLRLENFIILASYLIQLRDCDYKDGTKFYKLLITSIYQHTILLAKESFYQKNTNHGIIQSRALLLGALSSNNVDLISLAKKRVLNELDFAFSDEGVHVENSPHYHFFVMDLFINIVSIFPKALVSDIWERFYPVLVKGVEFGTYILRPDARMPIIGDTQLKLLQETECTFYQYNDFECEPWFQRFRYAISQGENGVKPNEYYKIYPKSGYAVLYKSWTKGQLVEKSMHIVCKAGCLSRYHHHQDESNVILFAYGEDWLIDSGLYNHHEKDPIRRYMRRRSAHNVPLIADTNYHHDFEYRNNSWSMIEKTIDGEYNGVIMRNSVLQHIEQQRTVTYYINKKILTVEDRVDCTDKKARFISLPWHIPCDKKIVCHNDGLITIEGFVSGRKLALRVSGTKRQSTYVQKGIKSDKILSCVSHDLDKYEDSQVIKLNFGQVTEIKVLQEFYFIDS